MRRRSVMLPFLFVILCSLFIFHSTVRFSSVLVENDKGTLDPSQLSKQESSFVDPELVARHKAAPPGSEPWEAFLEPAVRINNASSTTSSIRRSSDSSSSSTTATASNSSTVAPTSASSINSSLTSLLSVDTGTGTESIAVGLPAGSSVAEQPLSLSNIPLIGAVMSAIDFLDEVVVCFNDCSDCTEDRLRELLASPEEKDKKKLKVFEYMAKVYGQGTKEFLSLPPTSPHSLVNYYNFCMSRARFSHAIKLDGDTILNPIVFGEAMQNARETLLDLPESNFRPLSFKGVNLIRDPGGKGVPCVWATRPTNGNGDCILHRISQKTVYIKGGRCEKLSGQGKVGRTFVNAWFHFKALKRDFGAGNYDLKGSPDSQYAQLYRKLGKDWQGTDAGQSPCQRDETTKALFSRSEFPKYLSEALAKEYSCIDPDFAEAVVAANLESFFLAPHPYLVRCPTYS
uniref:Hexosyltransferase n=1 Tax=Chromera velia CCMP2878 TaxID=1169474 RepID=A0A0G4FIF8_9ALVE|eukprot:Cvel_3344.t1-p1 / transcript=Cvel_3344.t1 / gene=Cvel_3344 / organism=Chromera_velia_CCMP2878 / gene_product=hypothetical protein / transcript_product=hypothetical protein / location=Cvel_scaffold133:56588-58086(-) / protein_length=456 / sequence_SO=supercontig / SO=protein_coding / is_pseudo=false